MQDFCADCYTVQAMHAAIAWLLCVLCVCEEGGAQHVQSACNPSEDDVLLPAPTAAAQRAGSSAEGLSDRSPAENQQ
jgi:hypothetical protein